MCVSKKMDGQGKSLDQNRYAQVFFNSTFFAEIYPMTRNLDVGFFLKHSSQSMEYLDVLLLMVLRIIMQLLQSL